MGRVRRLADLAGVLARASSGQILSFDDSGAIQSTASSSGTTVYADMTALIAATGMSSGDQALVTATNNIYIYNGSGWYKIATVQNDSPSAITGVNGSYALAIDGTPTVITAVSTDPEGFPLTWTYSTSGLGSIATVSQADNVFTITPSTTEADAGTFSLTINATDGVNGAVSASTNLTLDFIVIVENSKYTTLLVTADDISDNNNITDSSTNNHTITVTGDAHAGTFSPYRHSGYSTYFDGTGDYLFIPDDSTLTLTGDQTIEAFVYLTAYNTTNPSYVVSKWQSNADEEFVLSISTTGVAQFWFKPVSGGAPFLSGGTVSLNTWTHLAVVRSGNDWALFVDGNRVSNGSNTGVYTDTNSAVTIGSLLPRVAGFELTGYISDVRLVKGTAVYSPSSTTLTVPTERLTAITNTSLLTCHLPYIADGSSNGHTITLYGNTSTKPFTPYDNSEYASTDHGGSVYFGASSSYLYAPTGEVALGSGDFTAEVWLYPNSVQSAAHGGGILDWRSAGNAYANIPTLNLTNSSGQLQMHWRHNAGAAALISSSSLVIFNTWNHCVIERSGTTITMYLNGKNVGSVTNNSDDLTVQRFRINDSQGSYTTFGHFSDARITIGSAVYGSEFTPPTASLSSTGSTLHVKGTDASIIDKSQSSNLKLVGNTTGSTTEVKFAGSKSIYFDGSGDYVNTTVDGGLGSGDFTLEFWFYRTSAGMMFNSRTNGVNADGIDIFGDGRVGTSGQFLLSGLGYNNLNVWYHIALVRSGTTFAGYIDGIFKSSITNSSNFSGSDFYIGGSPHGNVGYHGGYIQDFRLTKGLARYTANFTPPTELLKG